MARAQVTHSVDAVQITFRGDKRQPEPSTAVIQFPGGHVEVSRCSDGTYWAHITVVAPQNTVASRVDYDYEGYSAGLSGLGLPQPEHIQHVAIRIAATIDRPDHE